MLYHYQHMVDYMGCTGGNMYQWQLKRFSELSTAELYDILRVRQAVFVVEQECAYLDTDGLDQVSWHLFAQYSDDSNSSTDDVNIAAYLRIVAPTYKYAEPSIGRVLTLGAVRGQGLGQQLMEKAIAFLALEYPGSAIRISAQEYLLQFYTNLGFIPVSEPYEEDGIPHLEMLRK
jgi:ElaA protein